MPERCEAGLGARRDSRSNRPMSTHPTVLADVGGTNTRLTTEDRVELFRNDDLTHLEDALEDFVRRCSVRPGTLLVSAAGPEEFGTDKRPGQAERLVLTNRGWVIDRERLKLAGFSDVRLYNDGYAAAQGVLRCATEAPGSLRPLAGAGFTIHERIAVIALGTGIAHSAVLPGGEVIAGEGGHMPAALSEGVLADFRARSSLATHPSYERVLSGTGLKHLIEVYPSDRLRGPADVVPAARDGDPQAQRILDVFHETLARLLSTAVSVYRATGGVCLIGDFLREWGDALDPARLEGIYLEDVPLALRGAPVVFLDHDHVPLEGLRRLSGR